ncbi:unnamed protein product, partial [Meganyctiphanes norvegica]
ASAKALGEQVLEVTDSLSLDDVVCGRGDQPLEHHQFTIALLLLLNEVRVQIGATLESLNQWLGSLMPLSFKKEGLEPCETSIADLLRSLTKDGKTPNLQGLKQVIPKSAFIAKTMVNLKTDAEKKKKDIPEVKNESTAKQEDSTKEGSNEQESNDFDKNLLDSFEYFLKYVNLDKLMNNTAAPVAISDFKQHLLYSLWKYKLMIRAKDLTLMSWIQQICPVSLNQPSLEKLAQAAKSLYEHMQENPQDQGKLNLPLLVQKSPADTISETENKIEQKNEQTLPSKIFEDSKPNATNSELARNDNSKSSSSQKHKNVKSVKRKRSLKGNKVKSIQSQENITKVTDSNLENVQLRVTNLEKQSKKQEISEKYPINNNDKVNSISKISDSIADSHVHDRLNSLSGSIKESLYLEVRKEKELNKCVEMISDDINEIKSPSKKQKEVVKEMKMNKCINNTAIDIIETTKLTSDKSFNFFEKYDKNEDSEVSNDGADNELALKVQELERQLKEVKQQNMKLLEITHKNRHNNNNNHLATK